MKLPRQILLLLTMISQHAPLYMFCQFQAFLELERNLLLLESERNIRISFKPTQRHQDSAKRLKSKRENVYFMQ
jgi:hypothetical protein